MIKQTYRVFYRQWLDYFDFLEVKVALPNVVWGKYGISDKLYFGDCLNAKFRGYFVDFKTHAGLIRDAYGWTFDLAVFGFGIQAHRQWSY